MYVFMLIGAINLSLKKKSLSNRKLKTCSHSHHVVTPSTIKKNPHQKPKISHTTITIHFFPTTLNYVALQPHLIPCTRHIVLSITDSMKLKICAVQTASDVTSILFSFKLVRRFQIEKKVKGSMVSTHSPSIPRSLPAKFVCFRKSPICANYTHNNKRHKPTTIK
jgi:hypothetical protein